MSHSSNSTHSIQIQNRTNTKHSSSRNTLARSLEAPDPSRPHHSTPHNNDSNPHRSHAASKTLSKQISSSTCSTVDSQCSTEGSEGDSSSEAGESDLVGEPRNFTQDISQISDSEQTHVIIIGAGVSGLKAALDLSQDPTVHVTLLEARNRIGGRTFCVPVPGFQQHTTEPQNCHTRPPHNSLIDSEEEDSSDDTQSSLLTPSHASTTESCPSHSDNLKYVDLGAAFIEGWENNPMWKLAQKLNLSPQKVLHHPNQQVHFDYDGQRLSPCSIRKVRNIVHELSHIMFDEKFHSGSDISIGEAFQLLLRQRHIHFQNDLEERLFIHSIQDYENHNGGSLNALSLRYFYEGPEFLTSTQVLYEPDDCDLFVAGGYAKITEFLHEQLAKRDNVNIVLSARVEEIIYEGLHQDKVKVFVRQSDGSSSLDAVSKCDTTTIDVQPQTEIASVSYYLTGTQCICTAPLGVLKSNGIKFSPSLSRRKQEAICRIGFGLLDKVILAFPFRFWEEDMHVLNYVSQEAGKYRMFLNVSAYEGNEDSAILACYVAAESAAKMEMTPNEMIKAEIMKVLRDCFPSKSIPQPTFFTVTRWKNDPFSQGSFTFMSTKSSMEDFSALAEPVGNLFFAGEHTDGHYASMHGAYLSGERAASEVMSRRKLFNPNSTASSRAQSL